MFFATLHGFLVVLLQGGSRNRETLRAFWSLGKAGFFAIAVRVPERSGAMRPLSFMDQYQRARVGAGAEHPAVIVIVVHEGGRPIEEPFGILFGHIDATAAHGRAEVAVPVGAIKGVVFMNWIIKPEKQGVSRRMRPASIRARCAVCGALEYVYVVYTSDVYFLWNFWESPRQFYASFQNWRQAAHISGGTDGGYLGPTKDGGGGERRGAAEFQALALPRHAQGRIPTVIHALPRMGSAGGERGGPGC